MRGSRFSTVTWQCRELATRSQEMIHEMLSLVGPEAIPTNAKQSNNNHFSNYTKSVGFFVLFFFPFFVFLLFFLPTAILMLNIYTNKCYTVDILTE